MRHAAHGDLGERLTGRGRDAGLTREGLGQAEALAQSLADTCLSAIYASPRQRTQETAEALAEGRALRAQTLQALDEIDFGEWTGCTFAELDGRPEWVRWNTRRSEARCPGGESMAEAQARAARCLEALAVRHDGETVAIVTHCDIIRALLCWHEGRSLDTILDFEVGPAFMTRILLNARNRAAA